MAINFDFLNVWKSLTEDEKKKLRDQAQGSLLDVGAEQASVQDPQPALLDVSEPTPAAESTKEKRGLFGFDPLGRILPEDPQKREDVLMAMMQGFGGMMAAGGPSREPTNFLQVAGMGLGTGMKGYADARKESREGASLRATSAANQAKAEIEAKANDLIAQWQAKWAGKTNPDGSMPIAAIQELAQVYMSIGERDKAVSLLQEANTYQKKLNSDGMLIGPDGEVSVDDSVLESTTDLSRAKDAGEYTPERKNYEFAQENKDYQDAKTAEDEKKVKADNFKNEQDLRKEYTSSPVYKRYDDVRASYDRIQTGAERDSGAGDMGVIFGYMKMLDPGSVVREGEFATAENSAGIPDYVRNLYNKAVSGERLTPEQRQEFVGASHSLYAKETGKVEELNQRYTDIATTHGFEPSRIIVTPKIYEGSGEKGKGPKLLDIGEDNQKKSESVPTVNTVEDYHALPSGAKYLDPRTGKVKTKK